MVKFRYGEVVHDHASVFTDDATTNRELTDESQEGCTLSHQHCDIWDPGYSPHQSLAPGDVMVNCPDTTLSKAAQVRARRRNMVNFLVWRECVKTEDTTNFKRASDLRKRTRLKILRNIHTRIIYDLFSDNFHQLPYMCRNNIHEVTTMFFLFAVFIIHDIVINTDI